MKCRGTEAAVIQRTYACTECVIFSWHLGMGGPWVRQCVCLEGGGGWGGGELLCILLVLPLGHHHFSFFNFQSVV